MADPHHQRRRRTDRAASNPAFPADVLDAGGFGLIEWRPDAGTVTLSPGLSALLQKPPGSGEDLAAFLQCIAAKDRNRVRWSLEQALAASSSCSITFRTDTADPKPRWLHLSGQASVEADGPRFAGVVQDVSDRVDTEQRLQRQQAALRHLAASKTANAGEMLSALRVITETSAQTLEVQRVSVWVTTDDHQNMRCVDLFDASLDRHSDGAELSMSAYPVYFEALSRSRAIAADEAMTDPRTAEFADDYLDPLGISSLIHAPMRVGDKISGIVCHEHIGHFRRWTLDEQGFAASIADLAAMAIERAELERTRVTMRREENLLRTIIDNSPSVIYVKRLDGQYVLVNRQFEKLVSRGPAQIIGKTDDDLFPRDIVEQFQRGDREVMEKQLLVHREENLVLGGHDRTFFTVKFPLMTDSGIPYAICAIATDISERVKATEELESTRSLLMAAIECSPAGIIIADAKDGRIRFANNAARLIAEEEETALIGSRISALAKSGQCFHPDGTPFDPEELPLNRALMRGDTCANIEVALHTPDGGERFLLSNAAAVRDADGEVGAGILVFADITDRHHALEQVRESEDRFRKLADATREGVLIHEKDRILEFNDNVPGMFGHDRRELHAMDVYSLIVPDQREMLRSSVSRKSSAVIATRGLRRDGSQFDIEVSARQIMYEGRAAEVFAIRDVSEHKKMLSELERSESRYRSFIAASSEGIWRADVDPPVPVDLGLPEQVARLSRQLRLAECNLALAHMYGIAGTSEMVGKSADELFGIEDCAEILSEWIRAGYRLVDHESRDHARDGREIWSSSSLTGVIENRQLVRAWGTRHDITGRKLAEHAFERTNRFRTRITDTSPHIIYVFDILERKNIFVNHKFTELLGYAPEQIAAMGEDFLSRLLHPEDLAHVPELLNRWNEATDDDVLSTEYRMRDIHGNWRWFLGTDTVFERTSDGRVKRIIGNAQDITEQKNYVEQLEYQANHDLLTGLPNRNWLLTAIDGIIDSGIGRVALMLIDLDRFKEINDALGHELGDELLKQVGPRLRAALPGSSSRVARLGGDEFAVITHGSDDSPDLALPETVLAAIRQPFSLADISVDVSASIGVAMFPEHGNNAATLLRCADVAMYKAKSRSAGVTVYDASLDEHTRGRLELLSDMRTALDSGQLQLFYQPKICMPDRRISGFEALVRWQHPRYGLLTPKRFFHLIEAGHLIHDVTLQILAQALKEWRRWKDEGFDTSIAVNISVRNLLDDRFPVQVGEILREHAVDDGVLELEITESAIIVDPERAFEALKRINEMGVRLTIDDYGTGYSSLAYLKRLPLHSLKVDLSFIQQMIRSEQDAIIVESTISLAHNLGIMVVAEGVEDQSTYTALQRLGCDEAQGFYIARPMSVDEVMPWVRGTSG